MLSGAAVKAGVIGLTRFLPIGHGLPGWGLALASVGLLSAVGGLLWIGLRRWPVACLSLLIVAIILGALMLAG